MSDIWPSTLTAALPAEQLGPPAGSAHRRRYRALAHDERIIASPRQLAARRTRPANRVNPASSARSARDSRGRPACRRSTATWCRSTRISTSFAAELRPATSSQRTT